MSSVNESFYDRFVSLLVEGNIEHSAEEFVRGSSFSQAHFWGVPERVLEQTTHTLYFACGTFYFSEEGNCMGCLSGDEQPVWENCSKP